MKALQASVVNGAHEFALKNVPEPSIQKPHHILVRVRAAAVNPSDIMNSKGNRILGFPPNSSVGRTCDKQAEHPQVAFLTHLPTDHWTRFRRNSGWTAGLPLLR